MQLDLFSPAAPPTRPIVFAKHPRARRYVIHVSPDGTVRVTIPRWGSKREAVRFVDRERAWIEKELRRQQLRPENSEPGLGSSTPDPEVLGRAKRELSERLLELAAQHRLTVARVSIRNQKWRWGSCSRGGHISLNWRLVTMPPWVRDYVMIHELMHLKRMDHSPKFWKLVAAACPNYEDARRWLRRASRT
jgi:predicted metal-dependent hydrolase